jgi:hypothetical protein
VCNVQAEPPRLRLSVLRVWLIPGQMHATGNRTHHIVETLGDACLFYWVSLFESAWSACCIRSRIKQQALPGVSASTFTQR